MDKKSEKNETPTPEPQEGKRGNNSLIIALLLAGSLVLLFYNRGEERSAVSASFFQTELARGNVEEVSIGERRVYGTFKTAPDAPIVAPEEAVSTTDDSKETSEETSPAKDEDKKYLKKFYFNRSTDAGAAVELENQLKAGKVEYTYLEPDNTQQIIYFVALIGLPLAILFLPVHDATANEKRHHGRWLFIGL